MVDLPTYLARAPRDVARRNVAAIDHDVVTELQSVRVSRKGCLLLWWTQFRERFFVEFENIIVLGAWS